MRIAVIGAGVAGLACAVELAAAGHEVAVFEKARGAGGRTSSRRTDHGTFDHGCPVLARGSWLLEFAPLGLELADFAHGEVPVPRMSALPRTLAQNLDVRADAGGSRRPGCAPPRAGAGPCIRQRLRRSTSARLMPGGTTLSGSRSPPSDARTPTSDAYSGGQVGHEARWRSSAARWAGSSSPFM